MHDLQTLVAFLKFVSMSQPQSGRWSGRSDSHWPILAHEGTSSEPLDDDTAFGQQAYAQRPEIQSSDANGVSSPRNPNCSTLMPGLPTEQWSQIPWGTRWWTGLDPTTVTDKTFSSCARSSKFRGFGDWICKRVSGLRHHVWSNGHRLMRHFYVSISLG